MLEPRTAVARIAAAEQLSMYQLLDQYAEATGMRPEALQRAHDVLRVRWPCVWPFRGRPLGGGCCPGITRTCFQLVAALLTTHQMRITACGRML